MDERAPYGPLVIPPMCLRARSCVLLLASIAISVATVRTEQQVPSGQHTFQVVSIRRVENPADRLVRFDLTPGGRVAATNVTLASLLFRAYGLRLARMINLPEWAQSDHFDLEARAVSDISAAELPLYMQQLLSDRFALRAHRELRRFPIFSLVVSRPDKRLGSGLRRASGDCSEFVVARREWDTSHIGDAPQNPACESRTRRTDSLAAMTFPYVTMDGFARLLQNWVGRAVRNDTGLMGEFDIELTVDQQEIPLFRAQQQSPTVPTAGPSIVTALREQLGLELKPTEDDLEVLVIERVERPTPN